MKTTAQHNATQAVFELVLARPVAGFDLQHGRLIHLLWLTPEQGDRLVQFYLNGRLSGTSGSVTQREAWLMVDHDRAVEIELLAVEPASTAVDLADVLAGVDPATKPAASLELLRDVSLPIASKVAVALDGEVPGVCIDLFSPDDPRGGFGAVFGQGGFGYDASIGPGLGGGELGVGPLGSDGFALRWRDDTLPPGVHAIEVSLTDAAGLPAAQDLHLDATIDRLSAPPSAVALNESLQLTWD